MNILLQPELWVGTHRQQPLIARAQLPSKLPHQHASVRVCTDWRHIHTACWSMFTVLVFVRRQTLQPQESGTDSHGILILMILKSSACRCCIHSQECMLRGARPREADNVSDIPQFAKHRNGDLVVACSSNRRFCNMPYRDMPTA